MNPSTGTPIRLAYISGGFPVWALFVAQSQGLFERHGLDVTITHTGASTTQMQGLREGTLDVGLQLPDHVVRAGLHGADLCVLAAQTHAPDVALLAAPDIRDIAQLKGHRIAVDGARSGYALLLVSWLSAQGWGPNDYQLVEVGDSHQRVQALRSGALQASFVNPPLDKALIQEGFVRLTSTRQAFPNYPGPVVAARRAWADAHVQACQAFQAAWTEAWQWLLNPDHQAPALALALQHLGAQAPAAQNALQNLQRQGMPAITAEGMAQVVDLVWQTESVAPPVKPDPASYFWSK